MVTLKSAVLPKLNLKSRKDDKESTFSKPRMGSFLIKPSMQWFDLGLQCDQSIT